MTRTSRAFPRQALEVCHGGKVYENLPRPVSAVCRRHPMAMTQLKHMLLRASDDRAARSQGCFYMKASGSPLSTTEDRRRYTYGANDVAARLSSSKHSWPGCASTVAACVAPTYKNLTTWTESEARDYAA